ncbi:predicted protein [Naegleria gruberi]|uniref:Predicted protein n=1 Tax=Naegleria gruberi TaxID=5762 RepID=D2V087_NAEGR|nr:uncharacterized protein NAEGRDRAFT_62206 [Naegleria gruberi]EFC49483.1 predicted protein [Naegleria gruberi]|eukprot:XP_002682227.1 predicted protein [Naegleria gruberi strain NEG-M]
MERPKTLLQLIIKSQQKQISDGSEEDMKKCVDQYGEANSTLLKENPTKNLKFEDWPNFKQELLNATTIPSSGVKFGHPAFGKNFRSCELPLNGDKFAKQELPYFSQFHYKMEKDDELFKKLEEKHRSSIMFLGPSGCGKTTIRLLSKNPGMILTCTSHAESSSGLTTEY